MPGFKRLFALVWWAALASLPALARTEPATPWHLTAAVKTAAKQGRIIINEAYNFALVKPPSPPWQEAPSHGSTNGAMVLFSRTWPRMVYSVMATPNATQPDASSLADILVATLMSSATQVKVHENTAHEINGLAGVRLHLTCQTPTRTQRTLVWILSQGGCVYQLFVEAPTSVSAALLKTEAEAVWQGFRLLDAKRKTFSWGTPVEYYRNSAMGYELRAKGLAWRQWEGLKTALPAADFLALREEEYMAVVPLQLCNLSPHIELLAQGLLKILNASYETDATRVEYEADATAQPALSLCLSFPSETTLNRYCVKIMQKNNFGYLLVYWTGEPAPAAFETHARKFFDAFSFITPTARPSPPPVADPALHAACINEMGLSLYRASQFLDATRYFAQAWALHPDFTIALENQIHALLSMGEYAQALQVYEQGPRAWQQKPAPQLLRADTLAQMERSEEAVKIYADVFAAGFRDDVSFSSYLQLLFEAGRLSNALAEAAAYLGRQETPQVRLALGRVLSQAGRHEEALALLRATYEKRPSNLQIALEYIAALQTAEKHQEIIDICTAMLNRSQGAASIYQALGRSQIALKRYRDAQQSFEQARKQNPSDPNVKDALQYVADILGRGDSSSLQTPIPPVALSPKVWKLTQRLPKQPDDLTRGAYYLHRISAYDLSDTNCVRQTYYLKAKITGPRGLETMSEFLFPYNPLYDAVYLNKVEVREPDGSLIASGQVSTCYVVDDSRPNMATSQKVLHVPVPGLAVNRLVELELTVSSLPTTRYASLYTHAFRAALPSLFECVWVIPAQKQLPFKAAPELQHQHLAPGELWYLTACPALSYEESTPDYDRYLPVLKFTDRPTTWEQETQNYMAALAEVMQPDPVVCAVAERALAQFPDPQARIRNLAAHVRDALSYKAIEFGIRAIIPHRLDEIQHNRYGDCKDHALYLQQLLAAAKIPAFLALVATTDTPVDETPSLDAFDHMVVYCPTLQPHPVLDLTDKFTWPGDLPQYLADRRILILDPQGARFETLPIESATPGGLAIQRQIQASPAGELHVTEQVEFTGRFAATLRAYFAYAADPAPLAVLRDIFSATHPEIRFTTAAVQNQETWTDPLAFSVEYVARGAVQEMGQTLLLKLPGPWEARYLALPNQPARQNPIFLPTATHIQVQTRCELPAGYAPAQAVDRAQRSAGNAYISWQQTTTGAATNHLIETSMHLIRSNGYFQAARYEDLHKACAEAIDAATRPCVLKRTAAANPD